MKKILKKMFKISEDRADTLEMHVTYCNTSTFIKISFLVMLFELISIIAIFFNSSIQEQYFKYYIMMYIACFTFSLVTYLLLLLVNNKHYHFLNVVLYLYILFLTCFGLGITVLDFQNGMNFPAIAMFTIIVCIVGGYITKPFVSTMLYLIILTCLILVCSYCNALTIDNKFFKLDISIIGNSLVLFIISLVISYMNYAYRKKEFINYQKNIETNHVLAELNAELLIKSTIDPLTGLKNRTYLREDFVSTMKKAYEEQQYLATMVMDIDDFKSINDSNGHEAGDESLRAISEILKQYNPNCYRYGGEEFFAFTIMNNKSKAIKELEKMKKQIENLQILKYPNIKLTISIGIYAKVPNLSESYEMYFTKADKALYSAKSKGKNNICQIIE